MDIVNALINSFSPVEQQQFSKYLLYKHPDKESKDKKLLTILQQHEGVSNEEIVRKLYDLDAATPVATNKRNAYYQWRFILASNLEHFSLQLMEKDDVWLKIIKHIAIARFLLQRRKHAAAHKYNQKAGELASASHHYDLLNIIYLQQLDYAWLMPELNADELTAKYLLNAEKIQKEEKLHLAFCNIRHKLAVARKSGELLNIDDVAGKLLQQYGVDISWNENANLRYKTAMLVSSLMTEKGDYAGLFDYLTGAYNQMEEQQMFGEYNYRQKTDLLTHICLAANYSGKTAALSHYFDLLKVECLKHPDTALVNAKLLMAEYAILLSANRLEEAKKHILSVENSYIGKLAKEDDAYFISITTNLFSAHYLSGDFQAAKKYLARFLANEKPVLNMYGMAGLLSLHLIDCMLNIDRKDLEYVQFKIASIQKRFSKFLNTPEYKGYSLFLMLLKGLAYDPNIATTAEFKQEVENFTKKKPALYVRFEFLPFVPYLLAKTGKRIEKREA
jgi:hypothetical protein